MKKLKEYWIIILFLIITLSISFYWFEWKKYQAGIECSKKITEWAKENKINDGPVISVGIDLCLLHKGIIR
ncbi:MAG: hypothetical protein PHG95_03035 [Patescibacteria group bacterium]|nr:hypothetical protein [Patescibacteria group bacterium]